MREWLPKGAAETYAGLAFEACVNSGGYGKCHLSWGKGNRVHRPVLFIGRPHQPKAGDSHRSSLYFVLEPPQLPSPAARTGRSKRQRQHRPEASATQLTSALPPRARFSSANPCSEPTSAHRLGGTASSLSIRKSSRGFIQHR